MSLDVVAFAQKSLVARGGQKTLVVLIENSVASAFEASAVSMPAYVRSVQVTVDVGSQRSTNGGGARQKKELKGLENGPGLGGRKPTSVAEAGVVAVPDQVGNVVMGKDD